MTAVCSVLNRSIEIRAGIVDEDQPNILVSLYITLDRQSSLLLFYQHPHISGNWKQCCNRECQSLSFNHVSLYFWVTPTNFLASQKANIVLPPFFYLWGLIKVLFPRAVNTALSLLNVTSKMQCPLFSKYVSSLKCKMLCNKSLLIFWDALHTAVDSFYTGMFSGLLNGLYMMFFWLSDD